MKKLLVLIFAMGLLWATGASTAFASGLADRTIWGGNNVIKSGQTVTGDLTIFGGNTTIEAGAVVTGDLTMMGGNVTLAGTVKGNVVTFGGSLDLQATSVVEGNLVRSGGSVSTEEGYEVQGSETTGFEGDFNFDGLPVPIPVPDFVEVPSVRYGPFDYAVSLVWGVFTSFGLALVAGLLAVVTMLFLPDQTTRVTAAIGSAPMLSGGVGLLTLLAVPIVAVVVALTICLAPFSLIGLLVYALALFFGWLAFGILFGDRLASALKWPLLSPVLSAALGTFIITLLVNGINLFPGVGGFFSFLAWLVVASIGLGAVVLTRFGTRPYFNTPAPSAPAAPPPAEPPAPYEPPAMSDQPQLTS
jgi:Na+-transporting methylmalonyl-CoA/oxaloacetate decarboxylase gamma subunit